MATRGHPASVVMEQDEPDSLIDYLERNPKALDQFLKIDRRISNPLYRLWDDMVSVLKRIYERLI